MGCTRGWIDHHCLGTSALHLSYISSFYFIKLLLQATLLHHVQLMWNCTHTVEGAGDKCVLHDNYAIWFVEEPQRVASITLVAAPSEHILVLTHVGVSGHPVHSEPFAIMII